MNQSKGYDEKPIKFFLLNQCNQCEETFPCDEDLKRHTYSIHKDKILLKTNFGSTEIEAAT